jgi:hypothetical protein
MTSQNPPRGQHSGAVRPPIATVQLQVDFKSSVYFAVSRRDLDLAFEGE